MEERQKIRSSVGILTYNNEDEIGRCLESVRDFDDIIVADGGSSDRTIEIARSYGARVIKQSAQGKPIEDFSKERNLTLDAAKYDWFFYLDADEYATPGLVEEIRHISTKDDSAYLIYKVPYFLVDVEGNPYKQFKVYYQTRFFNRKCGAYFIKKVHEKIIFNENKYKTGELNYSWHVPLKKNDLNFDYYKSKVNRRLSMMVGKKQITSLMELLKALRWPFSDLIKQFFKVIYLRVFFWNSHLVPLRYELYRIYSYLYTIFLLIKKYTHKKEGI